MYGTGAAEVVALREADVAIAGRQFTAIMARILLPLAIAGRRPDPARLRRPVQDGLCRTQLTVRLPATAIDELLTAPLGNHVTVVPGHRRDRLAGWLRTALSAPA